MLLKTFIFAREKTTPGPWRRVMAVIACAAAIAGCENVSDLGGELRNTFEKALASIDKSLHGKDASFSPDSMDALEEVVTLDRPGVMRLQARLTELGFRPGPVDGIMGSQTVKAMNSYQTAFALKVTDSVTARFLKHLESMATTGMAEKATPPQVASLPQRNSPRKLASADLPSYLPGTTFIYSTGETERVLDEKDLVVRWSRDDGTTYNAHRNFLLPRSYWTSGRERGTAKIAAAPDALWPASEGASVSFKAEVTMQRGNDPESTERRVDRWRCENQGGETLSVEAGTFETLVFTCRRGADTASPDMVRTWYYSKDVGHYVRYVETVPDRHETRKADLVAIRPGALTWPPIVRAALTRALVHALEKDGDTAQMPWTSSGVSTRVTIEAKSRFSDDDGNDCRRFVQIWSENGLSRHYPAVACKSSEGTWAIPGLQDGTADSLATTGGLS